MQMKIQRLEAEKKALDTSEPIACNTEAMDAGFDDEEYYEQEYSDDDGTMDYSSLEESSQSAAEIDKEITKNTVR